MSRFRVLALAVALACVAGWSATGQIPAADAELQYQLGNLLSEETRYHEALEAYEKASGAADPSLAMRARKGRVRTALRLAEFGAAKGALTEADATLKDAKIKLSYTEIRSPITGRIGRAAVPPGNVVGPESGVLATVVAEQPMQIVFSVTQRELLEARRGGTSGTSLKAKVRLADDSFYHEEGTLDFIDVQVDPRTDGQTLRVDDSATDGSRLDTLRGRIGRIADQGDQEDAQPRRDMRFRSFHCGRSPS